MAGMVSDKCRGGRIDSRAQRERFHAGVKVARGVLVPSLLRFLTVVAILAGLVYGGMVALVNYVEPRPREMTVRIPPAKLELPN
jgi:hypothetical protein